MRKKTTMGLLSIGMACVVAIGWLVLQNRKFDDPANYAALALSTQGTEHWQVVENDAFGFQLKYPQDYFLAKDTVTDARSHSTSIALRQHARSAEEAERLGKRIGLSVYRLDTVRSITIGGQTIGLTKDSRLEDVERQFLSRDDRPLVKQSCHWRDFAGHDVIICVIRAPGEMPVMTGGIYEVFVVGLYEVGNGRRVLAVMSNAAGGTPHTGDRALRRDLLRIYASLRWRSRGRE